MLFGRERNIKQDCKEAIKWFREAANQDDIDMQNIIGNYYYEGEFITQDYEEAVKWYRKAAEKGLAEAQKNLLP